MKDKPRPGPSDSIFEIALLVSVQHLRPIEDGAFETPSLSAKFAGMSPAQS
jgi:hypothetical protein